MIVDKDGRSLGRKCFFTMDRRRRAKLMGAGGCCVARRRPRTCTLHTDGMPQVYHSDVWLVVLVMLEVGSGAGVGRGGFVLS